MTLSLKYNNQTTEMPNRLSDGLNGNKKSNKLKEPV